MGDDEQPAVGPTGDQAPPPRPDTNGETGPRHRSGSGRGGRTRTRKDSQSAAEPESTTNVDPPFTDAESIEATVSDAIPPEPAVGTAAVPVAGSTIAPIPRAAPDPSTVEVPDHAWLDQEAGPVVRPYTLTGGRSRPFTSGLSLLTHVEALYAPDADLVGLQPEQRAILSLARTATSVAELAARLDLPVGVVRVLVGDLIQSNLVSTFDAETALRAPGDDVLQAVIDGLRSL